MFLARTDNILENFPRFILAAISGDYDFVGNVQRICCFADGGSQWTQISLLVVAGNCQTQNGDLGHGKSAGQQG
jgi:hypothetical protein